MLIIIVTSKKIVSIRPVRITNSTQSFSFKLQFNKFYQLNPLSTMAKRRDGRQDEEDSFIDPDSGLSDDAPQTGGAGDKKKSVRNEPMENPVPKVAEEARRKDQPEFQTEEEKILQGEVSRLGKLLIKKDKLLEKKDQLLKKKDKELNKDKEQGRKHKKTLQQLTETQLILDVNELRCKALEKEVEQKDLPSKACPPIKKEDLKELADIKETLGQYRLQKDECDRTKLSKLEEKFEKMLAERVDTLNQQVLKTDESYRKKLSEQEERFEKMLAEREAPLIQQLLEKDERYRKELSDLEKRFDKLAEEETLKQQLLEKEESYRKELSEQEERFEKKVAEREDTLKQQLLEKDESYRKALIDRKEMSDMCVSWETKAQLFEKEKRSLEEVILVKEKEEAQRNEELQGLRQENTRLQELQEQTMRKKKKKKCFLLRIFQRKK